MNRSEVEKVPNSAQILPTHHDCDSMQLRPASDRVSCIRFDVLGHVWQNGIRELQ
jgi:hypothetical protein